jgi:hypothetical protein
VAEEALAGPKKHPSGAKALKFIPRDLRHDSSNPTDAPRGYPLSAGLRFSACRKPPSSCEAVPFRGAASCGTLYNSAVVGSMMDFTSAMELAGKPPWVACSRIICSFVAL